MSQRNTKKKKRRRVSSTESTLGKTKEVDTSTNMSNVNALFNPVSSTALPSISVSPSPSPPASGVLYVFQLSRISEYSPPVYTHINPAMNHLPSLFMHMQSSFYQDQAAKTDFIFSKITKLYIIEDQQSKIMSRLNTIDAKISENKKQKLIDATNVRIQDIENSQSFICDQFDN